jgi:polysaccharide deacetylase 2 family uncharacterized protein YibQ
LAPAADPDIVPERPEAGRLAAPPAPDAPDEAAALPDGDAGGAPAPSRPEVAPVAPAAGEPAVAPPPPAAPSADRLAAAATPPARAPALPEAERPADAAAAQDPEAVETADAGRLAEPAEARENRPAAPGAADGPGRITALPAPGAAAPETAAPASAAPGAAAAVPPRPPAPARPVATRRLPQILPPGAEAAPGTSEADAEALPETESGTPPAGPDPTLPALQRHAVPFTPDDRPMIAPVLLDEGLDAAARERLAALPYPLSVALDPAAPGADAAAAAYVAAGKEVVMLATEIPAHAAPSDLEVTFASHRAALPQAVALMDLPRGGFQENRRLTQQVATILADDGMGLITHDRGLNPAAQVAAQGGLPHGLVFRDLAEADGDADALRRLLERARFRAAQQGAVILLVPGRDPELSALTGWLDAGRGEGLALAPASAVLLAGAGRASDP